MLSEPDAKRLLYELCVRLGFCLPPNEQIQLEMSPPRDALSFTNAVFVAEGLDPDTANRILYRKVRDMVAAAYLRSENRRDGRSGEQPTTGVPANGD